MREILLYIQESVKTLCHKKIALNLVHHLVRDEVHMKEEVKNEIIEVTNLLK